MRDDLLLDTCALLWLASGSANLSRAAVARIDRSRKVSVSAISAWEVSLKHARGLYALPLAPLEWFNAVVDNHGLVVAPLDLEILVKANLLPWHHRDPADRFIIATAIIHSLTVVTADKSFADYGISVMC